MGNKKRFVLLLGALFSVFGTFTGFINYNLIYAEKIYKEIIVDGEKINRWIELAEIKEYDKNGKLIHKKELYSPFSWKEDYYEYDSRGNKIHWQSEYNDNSRGSSSSDEIYEYNKSGFLIYMKDSNSYNKDKKIVTYRYRKQGNKMYGSGSDGWEYCYTLNKKLLYKRHKNSYSGKPAFIFGGNSDEKMVSEILKGYDGGEVYTYDKKGNIVSIEDSSGNVKNYEYDNKGNKTYENLGSSEKWYTYDYSNNMIYCFSKNWLEEKRSVHILEYHEDGKTLKKDSCYLIEKIKLTKN